MKKALLIVPLVLILAATFSCQRFTGRTAGNTVDDATITGEIKGKILKDPDLKVLAIHVQTTEGNVTLSGAVPSTTVADRAVSLAKSTKGVKSVRSNLKVGG